MALGDIAIDVSDIDLNQPFVEEDTTSSTTSTSLAPKARTSSEVASDKVKIYKREAKKLQIKCIPEKYVRKMPLGPMVWNNKRSGHRKFDSYENFTKNKPIFYESQVSCTIWSAGASNVFEDNQNSPNFEVEDDGGYNLFITLSGRGYKTAPKNQYAYKIINKYLMNGNGQKPKDLEMSIAGSSLDKKYTDDKYFGEKPQIAVVTNIDDNLNDTLKEQSINDINDDPIRLYLVDDGNKRKENTSDTFFLRTYNKEKNDFSKYIVVESEKKNDGSENL